jgi:pyruvate-formate lyase-activating enzyme
VADGGGEIFELEGYAALGRCGPRLEPLTTGNTLTLPHGSELMYLPDRHPVLVHRGMGSVETVRENPFCPGEPLHPVAAFNSPGYTTSLICAYEEGASAATLPLFSYGAVGWTEGGFHSAVIRVDAEPRQDLRKMPRKKVAAGIGRLRRRLPGNRLRAHLETCAIQYGCPAAKNFFLGRYEAPLPTATACNARCLGCLSLQPDSEISCSQQRIAFTPSSEEIAAVALEHLEHVSQPVVSFGQGCEGDPLLAAEVIEPAIRAIRMRTSAGTVHMNTNGSRPRTLERLLDAGLDSVRFSMNSVRKDAYNTYFRPKGYRFEDVVASIDLTVARGRFASLNYLQLPGFTDTPEEYAALRAFVRRHGIHMIQWRNLNYDPHRYLSLFPEPDPSASPVGMAVVLSGMRRQFPKLLHGYFNPPKEKWNRNRGSRTPAAEVGP